MMRFVIVFGFLSFYLLVAHLTKWKISMVRLQSKIVYSYEARQLYDIFSQRVEAAFLFAFHSEVRLFWQFVYERDQGFLRGLLSVQRGPV